MSIMHNLLNGTSRKVELNDMTDPNGQQYNEHRYLKSAACTMMASCRSLHLPASISQHWWCKQAASWLVQMLHKHAPHIEGYACAHACTLCPLRVHMRVHCAPQGCNFDAGPGRTYPSIALLQRLVGTAIWGQNCPNFRKEPWEESFASS